MKNNAVVNEDLELSAEEVFKTTALLYLKDALQKQQFEDCKELVEAAKGLGAAQADITEVISGYLRASDLKKKGTAKTRFV